MTLRAGIIWEILDTGESEVHVLRNTTLSLPLEAFSTMDQLLKAK